MQNIHHRLQMAMNQRLKNDIFLEVVATSDLVLVVDKSLDIFSVRKNVKKLHILHMITEEETTFATHLGSLLSQEFRFLLSKDPPKRSLLK